MLINVNSIEIQGTLVNVKVRKLIWKVQAAYMRLKYLQVGNSRASKIRCFSCAVVSQTFQILQHITLYKVEFTHEKDLTFIFNKQ